MRHRRAWGWVAAGAFSLLALPVGAQSAPADCVRPDSREGILLKSVVDQAAKDIEAPRKAGDRAAVLRIAEQAQETRLCSIPANIVLAQAEALVATDRACDAGAPLEQYFAAASPGDTGYAAAEDLFEQVNDARNAGLCVKHVGGVAIAGPTEAPVPSHETIVPAAPGAPDDGRARDDYRGGELNEGQMAYDAGNYTRAAELFGIVIQQAPDSFEGYFRRAHAYAALGKQAPAEADYRRAIELGTGRGYLVVDYARFLAGLNRADDAIDAYDEYLQRYPNDVQVLRERALARQKAGLVDLALEDYGKAIALSHGAPEFLLGRAYVYHDNGRFAEAAADYSAAIAAGARGADVYYRRGLAYYALGQSKAARADFDTAIAADPTLADAYEARGAANQALGDGEAAITDFGRVIALRPDSADAYIDRAKTNQHQLHVPEAIADYSAALRIQPGNLEALKGRAMLYQQQGDLARAAADLTDVINRDYVDADAYSRRGWVYYKWADCGRAMDDFGKALMLDPNATQAKLGQQACADAAAAAAAKKR